MLVTNSFGVSRVVLAAKIARIIRTGVLVVERNTLSVALVDRFRSRPVRSAVLLLTRWLYRRADAIVGVSDGVSRDLEATLRLPAGSVITIYNPVDTDHITAAIDEAVPELLGAAFSGLARPVVTTTGRLVAQKAHRDLLDAFAALPDRDRGSLVILGDGPLRADLVQHAKHLGIAEQLWMPGFVDNPWWFIARSDVFALSSHWEGHPRALLEALACGVPIASTDCPSGPSEILEGIPNTRLTPVGDPAALAASIRELLMHATDSAHIVDMGRYAPAEVAARYSDVVTQAIKAPQDSAT
jgi:glycosyltransferase involved in cell wall biosynthesis